MKIGAVAKKLGLPAPTIRYYEREGLIDLQARVSGRREFDARAVLGLRFVQLAQTAGFSINDIKLLLKRYENDHNPSGMWRTLAESKRQSVRAQIKDLRRRDKILGKILTCDCQSIHECVEYAQAQGR